MNHSHNSTEFGSGAVGGNGYAAHHILPAGVALPRDTQYAGPHGEDQMVDQRRRVAYLQSDNTHAGNLSAASEKLDQPVRRRISRACDQCNQLRTKCDGKHPCVHCLETGLSCEYAREKKKRGKASRKYIEVQQSAKAIEDTAKTQNASKRSKTEPELDEPVDRKTKTSRGVRRERPTSQLQPLPPSLPPSETADQLPEIVDDFAHCFPKRSQPDPASNSNSTVFSVPRMAAVGMAEQVMQGMSEYGPFAAYQHGNFYPDSGVGSHEISHHSVSPIPNPTGYVSTVDGYGETLPSLNSQPAVTGPLHGFTESPLSDGLLNQSQGHNSYAWLHPPSHPPMLYQGPAAGDSVLRYPVLQPLVPYISSIIPLGLACDLLEHYFASTSSTFMHPQSPYLVGYVFRKQSFLRQTHPRNCNAALLASILWIAAQTSESAALSSAPSARGIVCHQLMELTVDLLKPLIHVSTNGTLDYSASGGVVGVALGGFGVSSTQDREAKSRYPGASGTLDDIATYLHLATVVSASEHKAASLRWWNAAWSLARELKLCRELPPDPNLSKSSTAGHEQSNAGGTSTIKTSPESTPPPQTLSEEEREERRRIWWLLYCMDRHLALCYNRPLFLLDTECAELFQPVEDLHWQTGEYYEKDNKEGKDDLPGQGAPLKLTGHSVYGYFLPLMTILGEIVELNQARNHPRFGLGFTDGMDWSEQVRAISRQLDAYGQSLKQFDDDCAKKREEELKSPADVSENDAFAWAKDGEFPNRSSEVIDKGKRAVDCSLRTRTVMAYGTYLMHTLQILLNGKWDPISLLDDNDLWISSPSFVEATSHAVSASEALNDILDCDPDLSFMPFFFGIYLLQGSFLLLLIADKLQGDASPEVIRACETIVRAHEACVVTLSTEYQKNFRKVMRSALSQVKGRILEDHEGQQKRRREVLSLYRWTSNGTGLAL